MKKPRNRKPKERKVNQTPAGKLAPQQPPVERLAIALKPFFTDALTRQSDGNVDIDNEAAKQEVLGLAGESLNLIINGQV